MIITYIYTNNQHIFQGCLNTHNTNDITDDQLQINLCELKKYWLRHSMDLNHHLKHEIPPIIMPRTSTTCYNQHVDQEHEEHHHTEENHQSQAQLSMQTNKTNRTQSRNIHKHHELHQK